MDILLVEFNPFQPAQVPISLGYLAAYAKKKEFSVRILNVGNDTPISIERFTSLLLAHRPSLIGFSLYQRTTFLVKGWAALCKEVLPGVTVLAGGPQATFMPTEALRELSSVDCICRSEGEAALAAMAERIRDGGSWPVPGWSGRGGEGEEAFWEGPDLPVLEDLDQYPSPYLDGTLDPADMEEAILLASRGCPYRCAFCYTPRAFGGRVRSNSLERVLEEIQWLHRHGIRRFWFADPNFTFDPDRVETLLEHLLERGIEARIWLETRADLVDASLLRKMRRAGVHTIAYGLESAADHVRRLIRKPLALDVVERAVRLSQEAGLEVELFCQYGLPGETLEDARGTLEFVRRNKVPIRGNTNAQQMQIYFGTEIGEDPGRFGIRPLRESRPAYLSIGGRYETDRMRAAEIAEIGRLWKACSEDGGKRLVS